MTAEPKPGVCPVDCISSDEIQWRAERAKREARSARRAQKEEASKALMTERERFLKSASAALKVLALGTAVYLLKLLLFR